ncbi:MAG: hypothetical protein RLY20_3032 [Verrucomicrobiota bacterium]
MLGRRWIGGFLLPAMTPAGFRKQFFNWKGAVGGLAVVGALCGIVFWAIPSWSRHTEQKWASQSRLLLERGYQNLAAQKAVRVLQKHENNEEACRVLADLCERQGRPEAVSWRRRAVDCSPSITNRLALAIAAVRFEAPPSATASRVLSDLSASATNLPLFHVVSAQYEARNGNLRAAESYYRIAVSEMPTNKEVALSLALLQLQMRNSTNIEQAEEALKTLVDDPGVGVRALRPLAGLCISRGNLEDALAYSERILEADTSTFEDRLAHLDVLFLKRDPNSTRFLRTLQEQVSSNPNYVAQLASWMTAHSRATNALEWIASLPPPIRYSDPALIASSYAYVQQSDWTGLARFLQIERRDWGTIEFVRQALLARCYRGIGDRMAFNDNFTRAKELAAGMSLRLTRLTQLADDWGWTGEVDELLWTMFDRFKAETWAADALLRRYHERGDTDGIRRVFTQQLARQPNDLPLKNNLAMVLLLLEKDLPKAHQLALESHLKSPESAVHTSTYAFSLYRQGRVAEARRTMESLGTETLKVPSLAVYYAVICNAEGDLKTAETYADLSRQADLLPEEKALIEAVRNRR